MGVLGRWGATALGENRSSDRLLWVLGDGRGHGIVLVAGSIDGACEIADALVGHGDVPSDLVGKGIAPCPPELAGRITRLAEALGVGETFLACLGGGVFLLEIGGLDHGPGECR